MLFLLVKVVLWVLFWICRYVPIVGLRLSEAYGNRVFRPVAENVSVRNVSATTLDDAGDAEIVFEVENESWIDIDVDGLDVRVGLDEERMTIRNFAWSPEFDRGPRNMEIERILSGTDGTITIEFLDESVSDAERTLWVDGSFVFQYSFEIRGRRFGFGDRTHEIPSVSVTVDAASETESEHSSPSAAVVEDGA